MANASKAKGTRAETAVVRYLNDKGIQAERRALHGNADQGDVKAIAASGREWTLEIKAGKQTANPSRADLEEWLRQARAEGINAGCLAALVVVRYRRKLDDADVYIPSYDDRVEWCPLEHFASYYL